MCGAMDVEGTSHEMWLQTRRPSSLPCRVGSGDVLVPPSAWCGLVAPETQCREQERLGKSDMNYGKKVKKPLPKISKTDH